MFFYHPTKNVEPVGLVGPFTAEESARICHLRVRFLMHPDHFKLGIDYRHFEFARWLVEHGRIGEWSEQPAEGSSRPLIPRLRDWRGQ